MERQKTSAFDEGVVESIAGEGRREILRGKAVSPQTERPGNESGTQRDMRRSVGRGQCPVESTKHRG